MNAEKSTVILLGAGFSKGIKSGVTSGDNGLPFPVSSDLLTCEYLKRKAFCPNVSEYRTWYKPKSSVLGSVLQNDIGAIFSEECGWLYFEDDKYQPMDFELLFSHCASMSQNPTIPDSDKKRYQVCVDVLRKYISKVLDCRKYALWKVADRLENFLSIVPYYSNIFTTNMDNIIEDGHYILSTNQLRQARKKKNYPAISKTLQAFHHSKHTLKESFGELGPQYAESPKYIKLHGGINYICCTNKFCHAYEVPRYFPTISPMSDPCPDCGGETVVGIMPPVNLKDYNTNAFFSKNIRVLRGCLEKCARLIIIGYSFPRLDTVIAAMVSRALILNAGASLHIVDPNCDSISNRFRNIIGVRRISTDNSLDTFLSNELDRIESVNEQQQNNWYFYR